MAFDFSKLNFFNRLNARSRVVVLFGGVIGAIFLIYALTQFFSSGDGPTGASHVAGAPTGLQSVPGGQLTPEYYRALQAANTQAAKQAQISGGSAVPTLIRVDNQPEPSGSCVICSDQNANVKNKLDEWVKQGKITPDVAKALEDLADQNVTVDSYAAKLDELVKAGKITPDQARELLAEYKKQHANALLNDSAKTMDGMMKAGQLPLAVANQLLEAQKNGVSVTDYAKMLRDDVAQGKLSPGAAQQLLTQYSQQRAKEIVQGSILSLQQMTSQGQITGDVEKQLEDLENRRVSIDNYSGALDQLMKSGKITPAVATKILDEFKSQKAAMGALGSLNEMEQKAEEAAYGEISGLLQAGKISQAVADQLTSMIKANVSQKDFGAAVNNMVTQGQLTPDIAKLKMADYAAVKGYREALDRLGALQSRNASAADYAAELKRLVQEGKLTPDQAAQLMQEYLAATAAPAAAPTGAATAGNDQFSKLQQQLQANGNAPGGPVGAEQFANAQPQATEASAQQDQQQIQGIITAMSGQAGQLINSWQPATMQEKVGTSSSSNGNKGGGSGASSSTSTSTTTSTTLTSGTTLVKAGTIFFAVLDTAVNSDYPDSPVMATIVEGPYKGAKMMGKLTTTKSVAGQMDRVSLNFTLMNTDAWMKSKTVTAYAIDPDTARTVLASNVNYHYMQRFGAIMATSFVQGYASAITNAGTSTTGIFGTTTTHPELNPGQKFATAIGQIGTALSATTQGYINIPPTVKVDSGVGLGILFMTDVS